MLITTLCLLLPFQNESNPDTITLTSGKEIQGLILHMDDEELILGQGTRQKTYKLSKIESIEGPRTQYSEYIQRLHDLFAGTATPEGAQEFAAWCNAEGYPKDAQLAQWLTLALDPEHSKAHESLGHRGKPGAWTVSFGNGKKASYSNYLKRHLEFKHAWEFQTAHFDFRIAGNLKESVVACFEMEQLHAAVNDLFKEQVGYHELREPIKVHVYPDVASFPPLSNFVDAYWEPGIRTIYSYFSGGRPSSWYHVGAQAVMAETSRAMDRKEPNFPGWLTEGVGLWIQTVLDGPPGAPNLDPARIDYPRFRLHHEAKKPDGITRVLNYSKSDFGASSGQEQKYAQAYTFIHFLFLGPREDLEEKFMTFLHTAWRGKGSTSHFKKVFGKKLDSLEKDWTDFVAVIAQDKD
ncbi:MAG: hypothetical protein MK213_05370 [Planctomycetes bacterium]|nr:hypothetical protein [Planctomycetota bacterium]